MTLTQLAAAIHERLTHLEAAHPRDYYYAGAQATTRRILTWTHSYQPAQRLTKEGALAYLATLNT